MGDALVADPALALRALLDRLPEAPPTGRSTPRPVAPPAARNAGTLTPDEVFAAVAEVWPANAVMVNESPSTSRCNTNAALGPRPGSYYCTACRGLGVGLPAAIGVALADPSRPVLAAIGDGSMQYSIQALTSAAMHQVLVTVMVLDNREYATLKWFAEREKTPNPPGLDMPAIDHGEPAHSYACPPSRYPRPANSVPPSTVG